MWDDRHRQRDSCFGLVATLTSRPSISNGTMGRSEGQRACHRRRAVGEPSFELGVGLRCPEEIATLYIYTMGRYDDLQENAHFAYVAVPQRRNQGRCLARHTHDETRRHETRKEGHVGAILHEPNFRTFQNGFDRKS